MPPKLAKGKGAKSTKQMIVLLDDIDTTVLSREQLESFCIKVHEAATKEHQQSEFLRMDRDKLKAMVAIATQQLTVAKASHVAKGNELQETLERNRLVMGEVRLKLNNLSCEKHIQCSNIKQEALKNLNCERRCHEERMTEIISDITALKNERNILIQYFCKERMHEENQHEENKFKVREKNKELCIIQENNREKIVKNETKQLHEHFENECGKLEKRKSNEITQLLKTHSKLINDVKHYYNKVIDHNLSIILAMKTSFQELKAETASIEKQWLELKIQKSSLTKDLNNSKFDEKDLMEKLVSSKRDQNELKYTKLELDKRNDILEHMKWEVEALNIRVDKQNVALDEASSRSEGAMLAASVRAMEYVLVLEYMASHLHHRVSETDAALSKISAGGEGGQQTSVDELNYQLATIARDRPRIIAAYHQILRRYHLHMDDTGFVPLTIEQILKRTSTLRILVQEE